jgi:hypothetical protein
MAGTSRRAQLGFLCIVEEWSRGNMFFVDDGGGRPSVRVGVYNV